MDHIDKSERNYVVTSILFLKYCAVDLQPVDQAPSGCLFFMDNSCFCDCIPNVCLLLQCAVRDPGRMCS
jgi:hypothetical protein